MCIGEQGGESKKHKLVRLLINLFWWFSHPRVRSDCQCRCAALLTADPLKPAACSKVAHDNLRYQQGTAGSSCVIAMLPCQATCGHLACHCWRRVLTVWPLTVVSPPSEPPPVLPRLPACTTAWISLRQMCSTQGNLHCMPECYSQRVDRATPSAEVPAAACATMRSSNRHQPCRVIIAIVPGIHEDNVAELVSVMQDARTRSVPVTSRW